MIRKHVSIVIPIYNESASLSELVRRINDTMRRTDYHYDIILVNDGSQDNSWKVMCNIAENDSHVIALDLAGNYGQTIALRAGFEKAKGEVIVAMDGDLQHDPDYIPLFLQYIEEGYDMVSGSKSSRPEGKLRGFMSDYAHGLICKISGVKLDYFGATFKAYRSYLLKRSNMLGDAHRFLGAIVARKGVRVKEIPMHIYDRQHGKSNYNWTKMFKVILDLMVLKFRIKYMQKPFRLFGLAGVILMVLGLTVSLALIAGSLLGDTNIKENYMAEFVFSMSLVIFGAVFFSLGIIAEMSAFQYFSQPDSGPYSIRNTIQYTLIDEHETADYIQR
jgi:glycosyltransferase involved in cell wall biosynthesis